MPKTQLPANFGFNLSLLCCFTVLFCFSSIALTEQLPTCNNNELKYDFTECDAFGGRWRVSVPASPEKCSASGQNPPVRVNKCFTSCEGGQFFNMTSLLCQDCAPGHYSLGGGIIIDSFNDSLGKLPNGFRIITESTKHTPELNKKCHGWFVDPVSHQLVSTHVSTTKDAEPESDFGIGCVSVVSYTVKVVKSGRLRFTYHYQIPNDVSSSLLFTFNFRLYGSESNVEVEESNSNMRFPIPTMREFWETVEIPFERPGLYVFSWKSVLIGNLRNLISNRRNSDLSFGQFGNFVDTDNEESSTNNVNLYQKRLSSGLIRIKNIIIEGVAYASECSPCDPGTFASHFATRECESCPRNTANEGFGAIQCRPCEAKSEYSLRGSTTCQKRPECGVNDFYIEPIGKCDPLTKQQKVQYKWIEPRICTDTKHILASQSGTVNCTSDSFGDTSNSSSQCDLGMELRADDIGDYCQFCPQNYYRSEKSTNCQPCPPFTTPYYALSVSRWNDSLPAWSNLLRVINSTRVALTETFFADTTRYLNEYFSRQCIRTQQELNDITIENEKRKRRSAQSYNTGLDVNSDDTYTYLEADRCDPRVSWQAFHDHIRTGPSALLDSYLVFSITIPGFRSITGGDINFVFETYCAQGDKCMLLFIETKTDFPDLQDLNGNNRAASINFEAAAKKQFLHHPAANEIIKVFPYSSNGRQSYRYKIDTNVSVTYSWIFKRSSSFQSYAKLYSVLLTNSLVGSAIECRSCPYYQSESMNQCVTCPDGKYLEVTDKSKFALFNSTHTMSTSSLTSDSYICKDCPPNHLLNRSIGLPMGVESCVGCGPKLITNKRNDVCFSNCTLFFGEDYYDLGELPQPILYRGGNLFTAGGTQYLHLFRISLCGHPKESTNMAVCVNNITAFANDDSTSIGVRSYICRSTLIPDGPQLYATQSVSLGDELLGISRESTYQNISVHKDFLSRPSSSLPDYHMFFSTKAATTACPNGRRMTITMRCSLEMAKTHPDTAMVSTPKSCPDGTCDGCNFHLLIETGTAAACRVCRPFSSDYNTLAGECIDGQQDLHFINPKGCVVKKVQDALSGTSTNVIKRSCTVLLPRNIQIGIAVSISIGLVLLMLVFYFWNQNRSLEYKYTKLIENSGDGKDMDNLDNCCVEEADEEDMASDSASHQIMFSDDIERHRDVPKESRNKQFNRIEKSKKNNLGSSREVQQLFGNSDSNSKQVDQSTSLIGNGSNRMDHEGYETIHLTSAVNSRNQIA